MNHHKPILLFIITYFLADDSIGAKLSNIKKSEPILNFENKKYNDEIKKCLRIWPQDNDTEGFFVAKIRKS